MKSCNPYQSSGQVEKRHISHSTSNLLLFNGYRANSFVWSVLWIVVNITSLYHHQCRHVTQWRTVIVTTWQYQVCRCGMRRAGAASSLLVQGSSLKKKKKKKAHHQKIIWTAFMVVIEVFEKIHQEHQLSWTAKKRCMT